MATNPKFWKLSHGRGEFNPDQLRQSIEQRLAYVHCNTGAIGGASVSQAEHFIEKDRIGDYFYLTHGNEGIYLIGQLAGPPNWLSVYPDGWIDRPFRLILNATEVKPYSGEQKWWAPNFNSTFVQVPDAELQLFEDSILLPHFGIRLSQFRFPLGGL